MDTEQKVISPDEQSVIDALSKGEQVDLIDSGSKKVTKRAEELGWKKRSDESSAAA